MRDTSRATALRTGLGKNGKVTHGVYHHPLYRTLAKMRERCYSPRCREYRWYGGRGIIIDQRWDKDPAVFVAWCEANGWQLGYHIDRIDNDGPYSPENCQWLPPAEHYAKHLGRSRQG